MAAITGTLETSLGSFGTTNNELNCSIPNLTSYISDDINIVIGIVATIPDFLVDLEGVKYGFLNASIYSLECGILGGGVLSTRIGRYSCSMSSKLGRSGSINASFQSIIHDSASRLERQGSINAGVINFQGRLKYLPSYSGSISAVLDSTSALLIEDHTQLVKDLNASIDSLTCSIEGDFITTSTSCPALTFSE